MHISMIECHAHGKQESGIQPLVKRIDLGRKAPARLPEARVTAAPKRARAARDNSPVIEEPNCHARLSKSSRKSISRNERI